MFFGLPFLYLVLLILSLVLNSCGRAPEIRTMEGKEKKLYGDEEKNLKDEESFDKRLVGKWRQGGWIYYYDIKANEDGTAQHKATILATGEVVLDIDTIQKTFTDTDPHRIEGTITTVRVSAIPDQKPVVANSTFTAVYSFPAGKEGIMKMQCSLTGQKLTAFNNDQTRTMKRIEEKAEQKKNIEIGESKKP